MLKLNNIEKLKSTYIGNWEVMGVEECGSSEHHINADHYNIRLRRPGGVSAAIQIERNAGEFGYNVYVCYEEYDNFISNTPWPKDRLLNKDNFLVSMQGVLDTKYNKQRK
jgi:hypothetical protein